MKKQLSHSANAMSFLRSCYVASLLCLFFFCSCKPETEKVPSGILPKDKMIVVLVDIHIAESSNESKALTSTQLNAMVARKYDYIMKQHDTTFDQFKTSFDYYLQHPEQFEEIYQEVVNRLTALEGKARAKKPHMEKGRLDSLPAR